MLSRSVLEGHGNFNVVRYISLYSYHTHIINGKRNTACFSGQRIVYLFVLHSVDSVHISLCVFHSFQIIQIMLMC